MPVSIVIGSRATCQNCEAALRWVFLPGVGMRPCEDFEDVPEVLEMHSCPNYPGRGDDTSPHF
jgi:hypothetical protein